MPSSSMVSKASNTLTMLSASSSNTHNSVNHTTLTHFTKASFFNYTVKQKLDSIYNITSSDTICFFALDIMKVFTDCLLQLGFSNLQFTIQADMLFNIGFSHSALNLSLSKSSTTKLSSLISFKRATICAIRSSIISFSAFSFS